ncbi:MAG: transposase [Candidatus Omnitrophica bacterium]|nr:transposase [Candidatus Omnitrophota bacterium]
MPRQARIVIPGIAHHITQRGNYNQPVFDHKEQNKQYCTWMNKYAQEYGLEIIAYCLMSNHVHFIVVPLQEDTLARVFNTVHMRYSHYVNGERGVKGHLWQGRFYSCILDDKHLYRAIRYVENNSVCAKIVKESGEYEWSSGKDHLGLREKPLIKLKALRGINKTEWKEYLKENDVNINEEIKLKTSRGLVVGTDKFIKDLENRLNRSLKCLKWGRPKKN